MATTSSDAVDPNRKVALLTGITGQDGAYLTEFLLKKGYHVHGIIRRSSSFNTGRLEHLYQDPHSGHARILTFCTRNAFRCCLTHLGMILHYGDLTDSTNLMHIISQVNPTEIYNLGAQSHVKVSFGMQNTIICCANISIRYGRVHC